MNLHTWAATAVFVALTATSTHAQLSMKSGESAPMKTELGYGISLNKASTLKRQWVYIHDPKAPAEIEGPAEIFVKFQKDYLYAGSIPVKAKQDLTAVELVHLVVDVFGRRLSTLQNSLVADISTGNSAFAMGEWRIWTEPEASTAHTVFTYVRSARLADGRVYNAPLVQVFEAIRKGAPNLTSTDIEPKKPEPK